MACTYLLVPDLQWLAADGVHDRQEAGLECVFKHGGGLALCPRPCVFSFQASQKGRRNGTMRPKHNKQALASKAAAACMWVEWCVNTACFVARCRWQGTGASGVDVQEQRLWAESSERARMQGQLLIGKPCGSGPKLLKFSLDD